MIEQSDRGGESHRISHHIQERLPVLIARVLSIYEGLSALESPDDLKSVGIHQATCRSLLSHLEALLKIRRSLDVADSCHDTDGDSSSLEILLAEARSAIADIEESQ